VSQLYEKSEKVKGAEPSDLKVAHEEFYTKIRGNTTNDPRDQDEGGQQRIDFFSG